MWNKNIEKYLTESKDEKIAIYGTNDKTWELTEFCGKDRVCCLVDEKCAGNYVEGLLVCALDSLPLYGVNSVIVTTTAEDCVRVYQKLQNISKEIKVIDIFGRLVSDMYANMIKMELHYGNYNLDSLKAEIDKNLIIVFDIDNTVFMQSSLECSEFYKAIEDELVKRYAGCELFSLKMLEYRKGNKYISLKNIIKQVIVDEKMGEVDWNVVWDIVYNRIKKDFIPRKDVLDAIQYANSRGKIISLVEDMPEYRIDREFLEMLFKDNNIEGINSLVCTTELGKDKETGLLEDIRLRYGDVPCLYVGDDRIKDLYIPRAYNMNTFWVKNPLDLFECTESIDVSKLKGEYVSRYFGELLQKFYCDKFSLEAIENQSDEKKSDILNLKRMIKFEEEYNVELKKDSIVSNITLFDDVDGAVEQLYFKEYKKPKVSVVIPVYNQFGYTYNCLKAILAHTEGIAYEVIIADDCSTDEVKNLEDIVHGIKVIHNTKNLKFLLNCNNAAKYAKGQYIVFLNNDTQVQPGWLHALLDVMDKKKDAGMVGSKLLYPNGKLQEAGGILWKDGSAWNYGHFQNPDASEFCYVKEVDYISGAAIMISHKLWLEIGGFDEAFEPAYYEDTDLAFEVRKHGYKVYFQPASLVVHFEGISNGTDTSTGLKKYQVVNQKKFFQKWKDVLGHEHFENGHEVYLAKDRGQTKTQILVVDHYVPNFDKDAGGRCTFMYIKMFLNMGMKVTFIGDNYAKPMPYTEILEQMGVEVLYGDYYCLNIESWLRDNLKHFDYVYLQRPHISIKYINIVKKYSRAKVFYFAHDLHHVRLLRDYEVTGNEEALHESEKWKKVEYDLFEKADVGHVVGSYEQKIMQKAFPYKPIRNIPLYIYDDEPENIEKDFSKRQDILFVGGFAHQPNVDAVLWFAKEVFPSLLDKYPELIWHIVGSRAPQEVLDLANDHIVLEGFVTDEQLGDLYRKSRLVVVPLRYGAGVKGKIVEAAYYQIPVVTTHIGGEGIDDSVGAFVMRDDAESMTDTIEKLYTDYETLRKMSDAGEVLIKKYYTSEAAQYVLRLDMNIR